MALNLDKEEEEKKRGKKKREIKIKTFDCLAIELRKGNIRRGEFWPLYVCLRIRHLLIFVQ